MDTGPPLLKVLKKDIKKFTNGKELQNSWFSNENRGTRPVLKWTSIRSLSGRGILEQLKSLRNCCIVKIVLPSALCVGTKSSARSNFHICIV